MKQRLYFLPIEPLFLQRQQSLHFVCTNKYKAIYFISEKLVILLDRNKIVDTMYDAYRELDGQEYQFGTFISGPSKTADIEQALVMGAHGARDVLVILT